MSAAEVVYQSRFETALGPMNLAATRRGLLACTLPGRPLDALPRWLARRLPAARVVLEAGPHAGAIAAVQRYLAGGPAQLTFPLDLRGTPFQLQVWTALCAIPFGHTISYAELARRVGRPRAVRACGSANGSNPLPLFVPCHRVVASDGALGGFGGGLPLKRRLLDLEQGALFGG